MNVRRVLAATLAIAASSVAAAPLQGQLGLSVGIVTSTVPPPMLPEEYDQPEAPGDGYIWTPGYWAWDDAVGDYFWVPGTWVMPPEPGLLWTPGYWAFDNGSYGFRSGYWGEHVGFYGGVNYGFGYFGTGYEGGYWNGDRFFYNTSISNINRSFVRNTYVRAPRPEWFNHGPRWSFNGGYGGINARPSRGEERAFREHHVDPTGYQRNQQMFAQRQRTQFSGFNHGEPPVASTPRPVQGPDGFRNGATPAQGAPSGIADWSRNRGNDNRGSYNGDDRGRNGYNARGDNGVRDNGGGRNGFNGNGSAPGQGNPTPPQQSNPVQNPPQNNRGGWNGPGDGRFRPQPPMTPRMPIPPDSGNGGRFNGGQPPQPQPAPTQPIPPSGGSNNGGGRPPQGWQPGNNQPSNSGGQQGGGNRNGGGNPGGNNQGSPQNQNRPAPSGVRQFERMH